MKNRKVKLIPKKRARTKNWWLKQRRREKMGWVKLPIKKRGRTLNWLINDAIQRGRRKRWVKLLMKREEKKKKMPSYCKKTIYAMYNR
jgi:hypothetical protein